MEAAPGVAEGEAGLAHPARRENRHKAGIGLSEQRVNVIQFGVAPDGCPKKYTNVVVTKTKIEIKQTIYFDFNKARIKPVSLEKMAGRYGY